MRTRMWAVAAMAAAALVSSTACGHPGGSATGPTATPGQGLGSIPTTAPAPAPVTTAPPEPTKAVVPALTCTQIRNAPLGSNAVKYNGYLDGIPLSDGIWSGEDGNTVTLTVCATGDLNGDGAVDALGSVRLSNAGTGQFYTLAVWLNSAGHPSFTALKDLDDRTPVQTISIAAGKATVVYFTRHPDEPMAQLSIKRTAVFKLSGTTLTELGHSDAPYTP